MSKSTIWISYDLGIRGDYESVYSWLDAKRAKECGDSIAVLTFEYTGSILDKLKAELKKAITVDKKTRIYVVYRDPVTNKNRGSFIFGGRKAAAWTGYSPVPEDAVDEEA